MLLVADPPPHPTPPQPGQGGLGGHWVNAKDAKPGLWVLRCGKAMQGSGYGLRAWTPGFYPQPVVGRDLDSWVPSLSPSGGQPQRPPDTLDVSDPPEPQHEATRVAGTGLFPSQRPRGAGRTPGFCGGGEGSWQLSETSPRAERSARAAPASLMNAWGRVAAGTRDFPSLAPGWGGGLTPLVLLSYDAQVLAQLQVPLHLEVKHCKEGEELNSWGRGALPAPPPMGVEPRSPVSPPPSQEENPGVCPPLPPLYPGPVSTHPPVPTWLLPHHVQHLGLALVTDWLWGERSKVTERRLHV